MTYARAVPLPLGLALTLAGCTAHVDLGDLPATTTDATTAADTTMADPTTPTDGSTTATASTTTTTESTSGATSESTGTTSSEPDTNTTDDPGTTGGDPIDCARASDGPWSLTQWIQHHDSSSLAFDGQGQVATQGSDLVIVSADTNEYVLVKDIPLIDSMRYLADGRLLASHSLDLHVIDELGFDKKFIVDSGFDHPIRVLPDLAGNVWIIDRRQIIRIAPDLTRKVVVDKDTEMESPRDLIYDEQRGVIFYANYENYPVLHHLPVDSDGTPGVDSEIYALKDGNADISAFALDACGNLYFTNYAQIVRLRLAPDGLSGPAQFLTTTEFGSVRSLHFGVGPGFDPRTLHVVSMGSGVWTMTMEFPGAPIVTVE